MIQGPAMSVKFLGMIWSGPIKTIPQPVLESIVVLKPPKNVVKRLRVYSVYWDFGDISFLSLV